MYMPEEEIDRIAMSAKDFAINLLTRDKYIDPVAIYVFDDGNTIPVQLDMGNKNQIRAGIKKSIIELEPQSVIIISDAWVKVVECKDDKEREESIKRMQEKGISEEPGRKDCLMVSYGSVYGTKIIYYTYEKDINGNIAFTGGSESHPEYEKGEVVSEFFGDVWKILAAKRGL